MTITTLLFDLDGTLLDTARDFHGVLNHQRQQYNLPPLDYAAVRERVSDGARAMVSVGFNLDEGDEGFDVLREQFLDLYEQAICEYTEPFAGITELLDYAKNHGMHWGIVTNKPSRFAEPLMARIVLPSPCESLICPDHVQNRKPHPEPIELACKEIDCDINQAIYIGDHIRDIEAGNNANMITVAVAWGYIHKNENIADWGADYIVESPEEIISLIKTLNA